MKPLLFVLVMCTGAMSFLLSPKTVQLNNFGYYWRDWTTDKSDIPKDAVPGGVENQGSKTYIAKMMVTRASRVILGKIVEGEKKVSVEHDNTEYLGTRNVQILCAVNRQRLIWADANAYDTVESVAKGRRLVEGVHIGKNPYIVSKVTIGDEILLGKVWVNNTSGKFDIMTYSQNGGGYKVQDGFQVLVYDSDDKFPIIKKFVNHCRIY